MSIENIIKGKNAAQNQTTSHGKTEAFLNLVNRNVAGKTVHGRPLVPPDVGLFKRMRKRELQKTCEKKGDITQAMDAEEYTGVVKDFTERTLKKSSPSSLGNTSLFLNSRHAFYPSNMNVA